ncbi:MAG: AAA family ATPase [Pseudomonadota bacterium]
MTLRAKLTDDRARGIVRLSRATLRSLGLTPGDPVSVNGTTHGRAMPAALDDTTVQIDTALAANASLTDGDPVTVTAASLPPLETVLLKPAQLGRHSDIKDALFDMALTTGDTLPLPGGALDIIETVPAPAGILTETTTVSIEANPDPAVTYDGIGGLTEQIDRVHEMIATPLIRPELYARLGIAPPRGVLFSGPPGSGKTLLARAVASKSQAAFFHINGPEIVTKHYGESEAALRKAFAAAEKKAPAIIFIDEIDAIAPAREALSSEKQVERRVVAQLLTLMDGLSDRGQVVVMAATNLPDALDPALRRPGRFDREIRFHPPTPTQRADILAVHLRDAPLAGDVNLADIAEKSHGYVGADLAALAREASVAALSRSVAEAGGEQNVQADTLQITKADLDHGLAVTAPSVLRGTTGGPPVALDDVAGLGPVKAALLRAIKGPRDNAEAHATFGVTPPRGILLAGPPGTGKTLIARALAHHTGLNFIAVRPPTLLSQFFGEAERAVASEFARARMAAPSLLFFDELDALVPARGGHDPVLDRIVAQFLMELDGIEANDGFTVLAATNRAAAIDPALTRPGRFDTVIELLLPDAAARADILAVHLKDRPLAPDVEARALATEGLSGADLAAIARAAAAAALAAHLDDGAPAQITQAHLSAALEHHRASRALVRANHLREAAE